MARATIFPQVDPEKTGKPQGTVTLLCGCMFAGKTTELLRRLDGTAGNHRLVFKHVIDNRYDPGAVVSHGGKAIPAIRVASAGRIREHLTGDVELLAVDEGHFFDGELVEVVRTAAARGLNVIITSLDRDSWGRPFPVIDRLRAWCHELVILQAVCARCHSAADHTQRLTPIFDGSLVGGPESYEPRCASCWRPPAEAPPPQPR